MPDEIRIARLVQQLKREGGNFTSIYQALKGRYGEQVSEIPFSYADFERYLKMRLPPEQPAPVSQYHPSVLPQAPPASFAPTSPYSGSDGERQIREQENAKQSFFDALHGITKVGRVVVTVAMLGLGVFLFVNSLSPKREPTQDQIYLQQDLQIAHTRAMESLPPRIRNMFEKYVMMHVDWQSGDKGNNYFIDLNRDKNPDGTFSKEMLETIAKASKENKVDVKALMTSLFILQTNGTMQPTSSGQIVKTTTDPPNVFVYNITPQGTAIDNGATRELQGTLSQILDALRANQTVNGRAQAITNIYETKPQATALVLTSLGGSDFERQLRERQGLELTMQFSNMARGYVANASISLATGNIGGAIGNVFAAWLTEQAAKTTIRGITNSNDSYYNPGIENFNPTFQPSGPGEIIKDKDGDLWRISEGGAKEYLGKDKNQKDCKPSLLWPGAC